MKFIFGLVATLAITFAGFSQKGIYVKYETDVQGSGENGEMMAMMMNGSTMELATSPEYTWVQTQMGTMMTMTMELNSADEEMTILMTGMMGNMAFQGNPDDMEEEGEAEEEEAALDMELVDETKEILGYECKKAIMTDAEGNQAIYWYTEEISRPDGVSQMPNQVPGLCLQFETNAQEGVKITYTAIEVDKKAKMSDYEIEIPEGTEVQSLEEMKNMGMGGM
ncbi:MAG: hypothetical protein Crog4KO_16300 [Crocinitomicaceae bacterium]